MDHFKSIIGQSPELDSLIRSAKMIAATDVTVLLKGETGTGKEVLASAIQRASNRADKPFIALNCAALPESLIESELFGHKKGSFTGATTSTDGLFKAADTGTLFLDEVNSLPLSIQAKLLRFLDSGECLAIGETKPYKVNTRVIAATNSDLNKQIQDGNFRQDLYFRLNVVPLELPPLSQRTADIELLIKHFMVGFAEDHSIIAPKFSKQSLRLLKTYSWPGNVRELRNLCERMCILFAGKTIDPENIPEEYTVKDYASISVPSGSSLSLPEVGLQLDTLEADLINQALNRTKGNCSKSARLLGISRDTLLYRMQKYGFATNSSH
jgi:DNA-binding NtrC family response regulator